LAWLKIKKWLSTPNARQVFIPHAPIA